MQQIIQLKLTPKQAYTPILLKQQVAQQLRLSIQRIHHITLIRRSIDARQKQVWVNLSVKVYIDEYPDDNEKAYAPIAYPCVEHAPQAIVVGAGPAGLFAALRLIERGIKPIVLERGKEVMERLKDIYKIRREQRINPESNYCFGEGGAGAFSDGKLYTRSKKRGDVMRILGIFCQHGADNQILIDAHPHIGTNKLPQVVRNMREQIRKAGGEVHFGMRVEKLLIEDQEVVGVKTHMQDSFFGPVILATGHSARDVYYMLHRQGVAIEAKPLAMGVRVEHPANTIDCIQYHSSEGRGKYLPAAEYSYAVQVQNRGVYSFCMCPGGFVVPASHDSKLMVVNGMSPANRGSKWSNSGVVVEIKPEDFPEYSQFGEMALLKLQEDLERKAWEMGGGGQIAPAQCLKDFVEGIKSKKLPSASYSPGVISSPLHEWLPPFIAQRLRQAFIQVQQRYRGYLTNDALVYGVESRTSSPLRILRDRETLQHPQIRGLFPCSEGAGYAGGIVSAAMDGEKCANALADIYFGDGTN